MDLHVTLLQSAIRVADAICLFPSWAKNAYNCTVLNATKWLLTCGMGVKVRTVVHINDAVLQFFVFLLPLAVVTKICSGLIHIVVKDLCILGKVGEICLCPSATFCRCTSYVSAANDYVKHLSTTSQEYKPKHLSYKHGPSLGELKIESTNIGNIGLYWTHQ